MNFPLNGSFNLLSGTWKNLMLVVGTADDPAPMPSPQDGRPINGSWLVWPRGLPRIGSRYTPVECGRDALAFSGIDGSPVVSRQSPCHPFRAGRKGAAGYPSATDDRMEYGVIGP